MEGANSATNWTVGCAESLILQVSDVSFKVYAHVVKYALFSLLLGHPFQQTVFCHFEDLPSSEVEVSVHDPANVAHRVYLSTCPCSGRAPVVKMISAQNHITSFVLALELPNVHHTFPPLLPINPTIFVLKYKKVDKKV